jgi:hypothetical protein
MGSEKLLAQKTLLLIYFTDDRSNLYNNISRFEVLTVVLLRIQVFWDVTECCLVSGS